MNNSIFENQFKIGILGGGQLGKMLALAAGHWHLNLEIMDASSDFPAAPYCTRFVEGDFKNFEQVLAFGNNVDLITIEIEGVNEEVLSRLKEEGKTVHPDPEKLRIIKDKGLQKEFFKQNGLPTSYFQLFHDDWIIRDAVSEDLLRLPFVQKARREGYDGRGIVLVKSPEDLSKLLPGPSLVEDLVPIEKELSVIVARNSHGEVAAYPPVEMDFHPEANLVEYLICPARVPKEIAVQAENLAKRTIETFDICGLLAVELFLTENGQLLINEVAPRPHNSGHHTIESSATSQFEQHIRAIANLPLGSTRMLSPAVMVNLLGSEGYTGPAHYQGMKECLKLDGVNIHLYGKKISKPFRKMGHVTVVDEDLNAAMEKAKFVKKTLFVSAKTVS